MGNMKQTVIVLSAQQYSMTNDETGEVNEGTSVRYLYADTLAPVVDGQLKGHKVAKSNVTFNNFLDFVEVPGVYDVDINLAIDKEGRTKVTASNFTFKKSLVK